MSPVLVEHAPAKVNLTLAVRRRRSDGFHDLESLVAFAACGDELRFEPGGGSHRLIVRGRTAAAAGAPADNLVLKAARLLAERVADLPGGSFTLVKRLPVAAGLGGGSSDAAAALRLLARAGGLSVADPRTMEAARLAGSDVPVCLVPQARFMRGTGDDLGPPLHLPRLPVLLVNPGIAVPTPDVFRRLGLAVGAECSGDPAAAVEHESGTVRRASLLDRLAASRNDLEAPAVLLQPVIAEVLAVLGSSAGCRLARMSGSGATVFGLYDTCRAAAAAGRAIADRHPAWWVEPTTLAAVQPSR